MRSKRKYFYKKRKQVFNGKDVINRAYKILKRGPLPEKDRADGDYCPWCALALAKGQLDQKYGTALDFLECLYYMEEETPADMPLVEARRAMAQWNDVDLKSLTQLESLAMLKEARKLVGHLPI